MRKIIASLILLLCVFYTNAWDQKDTLSTKFLSLDGVSFAFASENLVRPGFMVAVDMSLLQKRKSEIILSPNITFFSFQPFYTAWLGGTRFTYKYNISKTFSLRPITLGLHYKHKFMSADVYEVNNGIVEKISDSGYGNIHALATTGIEYYLPFKEQLPLTIYSDFGISAEPYFGVYRFHWEFYFGLRYNFRK